MSKPITLVLTFYIVSEEAGYPKNLSEKKYLEFKSFKKFLEKFYELYCERVIKLSFNEFLSLFSNSKWENLSSIMFIKGKKEPIFVSPNKKKDIEQNNIVISFCDEAVCKTLFIELSLNLKQITFK